MTCRWAGTVIPLLFLVAMVTVPTSPTLRGVSLQTKLPAEYLQVLDPSWRKQSPREAKARGKA